MKHLIVLIIMISAASVLPAGDISNTVFIDTGIGLASGAAIGSLTALGPYDQGKNQAVFGAGIGMGAMIGGFCGLAAGIWHAAYQASGKRGQTRTETEYELKPVYSGLIIQKNF